MSISMTTTMSCRPNPRMSMTRMMTRRTNKKCYRPLLRRSTSPTSRASVGNPSILRPSKEMKIPPSRRRTHPPADHVCSTRVKSNKKADDGGIQSSKGDIMLSKNGPAARTQSKLQLFRAFLASYVCSRSVSHFSFIS
jgi:hypothetical protein